VAKSSPDNTLKNSFFSGENYLAVFLCGLPLAILFEDIFGGAAVLKGQPWYVLVPFLFAGISGVLWLRCSRTVRYSNLTVGFLLSMILAWIALLLLEVIDGLAHNYTSFLVPLVLVMLVIKPVSPDAALRAGTALAWATILVVLLSLVHSIFVGLPVGGLNLRLPGISIGVVEGGRWVGPFGNPNYAGPAGAFLVVFAIAKRGWESWAIAVSGLAMVLLSGSRSAFLGLLLGLMILFIYSDAPQLKRASKGLRAGIVLMSFVALTTVAILRDPTLSGRTPIWPEYWRIWLANPLIGAGTQEIQDRIVAGQAKPPLLVDPSGLGPEFAHAHNLFLDLLGRYGIVGFVTVTLALGLAVAIAIKSVRKFGALSLALVLTFLAIGVVEVHGSWLYWSLPTSWLLIAVLVGSQQKKFDALGKTRH
jgi:O-antigen ligase